MVTVSQANGMSADDVKEERERERQSKLEQQAHAAQLDGMFEGTDVEYLREMVKSQLDPGTVQVLDNLISPDFVLSNMREADLTEFKYLLEVKVQRVFERHPPMGGIAGKERAYYYDDPKDNLSPLRSQDRDVIRSYKDGIWQRARRSKGGWQQDKFGETTSRVETVDNGGEESSGGRLRGLFG